MISKQDAVFQALQAPTLKYQPNSQPTLTFEMTTLRSSIARYTTLLASLLALLSLSGGIYGLIAPCEWASAAFGIPSSCSPAQASLTAARNVGSGVTLAGLVAVGNRQAVGIFLVSGSVTGLLDSWVCSNFGGDKAFGHAVMGLLIACLGLGVLFSRPEEEGKEEMARKT